MYKYNNKMRIGIWKKAYSLYKFISLKMTLTDEGSVPEMRIWSIWFI